MRATEKFRKKWGSSSMWGTEAVKRAGKWRTNPHPVELDVQFWSLRTKSLGVKPPFGVRCSGQKPKREDSDSPTAGVFVSFGYARVPASGKQRRVRLKTRGVGTEWYGMMKGGIVWLVFQRKHLSGIDTFLINKKRLPL